MWGGGTTPTPSSGATNVIDFVTISTLGNAADFGDLSVTRSRSGSCSNAIRGLFAGGDTNPNSPSSSNVIDYITISSLGNTTDFGDLVAARFDISATSSSTRGIFASSGDISVQANTIEYVTIMSTGNTIDFGDLFTTIRIRSACSNGHGGLG